MNLKAQMDWRCSKLTWWAAETVMKRRGEGRRDTSWEDGRMDGQMDDRWMALQRLTLLTTPSMEYGNLRVMGCKQLMREIGLCKLKQEQACAAGGTMMTSGGGRQRCANYHGALSTQFCLSKYWHCYSLHKHCFQNNQELKLYKAAQSGLKARGGAGWPYMHAGHFTPTQAKLWRLNWFVHPGALPFSSLPLLHLYLPQTINGSWRKKGLLFPQKKGGTEIR